MRTKDVRQIINGLRNRLRHGTAPLSRWCEFLLIRWPLYLALCLLFAAVCFLPALATFIGVTFEARWWWTLLAAALALPVLLSLVYMLHPLPPSPGWRFSRQPLSSLGDAEVVLADTSLLTDGQQELLIALPLEPAADLRKRPEALSLSIALAYTARLQNEETEAVLLETAAALGVRQGNLTRLRPVIGRTQLGPIPGVIVEDGKGQTSYFVGDPAILSEHCACIDGHRPRAITPEDQERIRETAQFLRQQGSLPLGFAMMDSSSAASGPVYLGLVSMRDVVSEDAAEAVRALLDAGYSLQTQPIDQSYEPPMRLAALRQRLGLTDALYAPQVILSTDLLDTRALCIAAADHRHRRFDAPVLLAREWFGKVAGWLRLALGIALPLLLCCVLGAAHPLCCLAVCMLLAVGTVSSASDDRRWDLIPLPLLAAALLLRLFLIFAPFVSVSAAIGLYAVSAAWMISMHLPHRWQLTLSCVLLGLFLTLLAWLLPGLSVLGGLLALLAGALAGFLAGQWLRLS